MTQHLDRTYWTERYETNNTGWDLGRISPPIREYIDQLTDQSLKILVPGCGNGYEAIYLWEKGFRNTFFLDFSEAPLKNIQNIHPEIPSNHFLLQDFFTLTGTFDLIIEQTLFCAIDPDLRQKYAEHVKKLLKPNGKLVGLLFNCAFEGGPPFGGSKEEYLKIFKPLFNSVYMEPCYNSIEPRMGNELFIVIS